MAGRNRISFGRDPGNAHFHGYHPPYGDAAPQHLGPTGDNGMGSRDPSIVRRMSSDLDPILSRRLPGPAYPVVDPRLDPRVDPRLDPRAVSDRSVQGGLGDGRLVSGGRGALPLPAPEPLMHASQQILHPGGNRLPYEQGGLMEPGGMNSSYTQPLPPVRGVGGVGGAHSYGNVDSYALLQQQQQQVQLSSGSLRTMYPVPELGGANQPSELKGMSAFRGGYIGPDEANFSLPVAHDQSQRLQQQQGVYQGRQVGRDGRLIHVGGRWEEDSQIPSALSPRAVMPMSPRGDEMVRMMSPRREDLTPPMSPRMDDFPHMMSPRRDDFSPPSLSPRRREVYPPILDYGGRLPHRRGGFSPSREEDFLIHHSPVDFPMSPRRTSPLISPRDGEGGWDYGGPPLSPRLAVAPMSPRLESPTRSPVWGRPRHSAKPPSQWDVLPGKNNSWTVGSDRPSRRESRRDYPQGPGERNTGFGADINDPNRWSAASRRGGDVGRYGRGGDDEDLHYNSGSGVRRVDYQQQPPQQYGMANSRPNAYNSVVNQRVGLVTKYIERERAEKAAKEGGRKRPAEDERPPADSSKSARSDRRNEKDTLAAAIAKSAANLAKNVSNIGKKPSKHPEKNSTGPPAASVGKPAAQLASNTERSGPVEKTNGSKPPSTTVNIVAETSAAVANGTAAAGSSGQPATVEVAKGGNQETKDPITPVVAGKAGIVDDTPLKNNVDGNSGNNSRLQSNGPPNNSANGNTTTDSKTGEDLQREPAPKRPSLVMEIERATKSRKLAEQQKHVNSREVEETYYDANELSAEFVTKMNKAGSRYSRLINDDHSLKRRYEGGTGQGGLHCLVCGKGSKTYSDIYELITHAQHSQVQSKRIDHMGFRKALIDVLKLDIKEPSAGNIDAEEDMIVWPPIVVVENTRTGMGADRRWEGVTNSEMALVLNELGHLHGRAKSIWDKFGHRGIVHVEFEPTQEGLQEAERLHNYYLQNGRGRVQWDIIRPFKTGLPGFDNVPEGPDFTLLDEVTKTTKRVLYGYLALKKDVDKIFSKKQRKKVQVTNRKEVKAKLLALQSGEQVVI
ncbi:unnamed protein product [Calypogeia fissa]